MSEPSFMPIHPNHKPHCVEKSVKVSRTRHRGNHERLEKLPVRPVVVEIFPSEPKWTERKTERQNNAWGHAASKAKNI